MKCPFCIKVCSVCKKILIANKKNFNKKRNGKYGLRADCNECRHKKRMNERDKTKEYNDKYREENKKKIKEIKKEYRKKNKEQIKESNRKYYEKNKEEILEHNKQYYEENKEEILEQQKQYYEENKEEILEKCKKYREENPHILFNANNKRREREENQGKGINQEQWLEMMLWFDFKCAYSNEYIGGKENQSIRSIDHIIPLNNGGLNEIWNCIPMKRNYNSSKYTKNALQWYLEQEYFDMDRLNKIAQWQIYAYEKYADKEVDKLILITNLLS